MATQEQTAQAPVKMYRSSYRLVIAAVMAGMEPDGISIEVTTDRRLHLNAKRVAEFKGENEILLDEWNPGPYSRTIELPNHVDGELANVTYRNGVLVVALPLSEASRAAQMTLQTVGDAHGEWITSHGRPVRAKKEGHGHPGRGGLVRA